MWQESLPRALKLPLSVLLPKRQPLPARPPAPSAAAELYPDVSLPTTAIVLILSRSCQARNTFSWLPGSRQQYEAAILAGWCRRMGCCPEMGSLRASPMGLSAQQGFGTVSASPHGRSSGIVAAQGTQHRAGSPKAKQNSPDPSLHPHFGCCWATSSFADHQLPQLRPDPLSAPAGQALFPRKHSRAARWLQCSLAIFGPTLQGNPNQKATTATLSFGFACCTHTHTHSALPSRAQRGHPLPHTVGRSGLSRPRAEQPPRSSHPPSLRAEGSRARGGQAEGGRELENTFI